MAGRRLLAGIAAAAVLLVILGAVAAVGLGVLAYGTGPARSGELDVPGLSGSATVAWPEDGVPVVEAADEQGLWTGLGYAHAADAAWAMTLWRQVALGNLAAWFPEREGMDRHARLLGFATLARHSWDALPADDRGVLEAYSRGVQAALAQPGVAQRDEFVLVDVRPGAWEPWHALAVERLIAWLGAPAPALDSAFAAAARSDTALAAFARADSSFRAYLSLGEFDHARAYAAPVGGQASFVFEQPWGASALPLFLEVNLRLGGRSLLAATIPGTLALPVGQDAEAAWTVFPTSQATALPYAGPTPTPDYDRLVDRFGNETLLTIPRSADGLFLAGSPMAATPPTAAPATPALPGAAPAQPPADSTEGAPPPSVAPRNWRVAWRGFAPGTDVAVWRALLAGADAPPFTLLRGDGLRVRRAGAGEVLGAPAVRREVPGGWFVAGNPAAAGAGERLADLLAAGEGDSLAAFADDAYSAWAALRLAPMVAGLGDRRELDPRLRDAYAFLRGWDASYAPDAIGASVFELWVASHRRLAGADPPMQADSTGRIALQSSLLEAVRLLRLTHGVEPAGWRWEEVQAGALVFPAWETGDVSVAADRYAPVPASRGGHPTALRAGPSPLMGGAPGVWTLWATDATWLRPRLRAVHVETVGFLARARSVAGELTARVLRHDAAARRVLRLIGRTS